MCHFPKELVEYAHTFASGKEGSHARAASPLELRSQMMNLVASVKVIRCQSSILLAWVHSECGLLQTALLSTHSYLCEPYENMCRRWSLRYRANDFILL